VISEGISEVISEVISELHKLIKKKGLKQSVIIKY